MSGTIREHDVTVYQGDVREQLALLPSSSAQCVVTSPPYYGLRDYGVDGQIGLEDSPAEFIDAMREVFAEVARVLRDDGCLWLNIGDSYYSGRGRPGPNSDDEKQPARRGLARPLDRPGQEWGTKKSLLMMPERLTLALLEDGWILRNKIAWEKPNAMPDSAQDRLSSRWEYVYLLTRSQRYYFDLDAIRVPHSAKTLKDFGDGQSNGKAYGNVKVRDNNWQPNNTMRRIDPRGANPGDVWSIATTPYVGAHFATFPPEIPRRCILASSREEDTVLDPFAGSGTTLKVARSLGRKSIGIELNPDYIDIIRERIGQTPLDFGVTA